MSWWAWVEVLVEATVKTAGIWLFLWVFGFGLWWAFFIAVVVFFGTLLGGCAEELAAPVRLGGARRRDIPTAVKREVWRRDGGRCVVCGATDELHFDHILPFSRGGTSLVSENVQLLCARHNIEKRDRIL